MAVLDVVIEAEFVVGANMLAMIQKNFDRPESDVRPWETVAVVPDDAPLFQGRPVVPRLWFRTTPYGTVDGTAISGSRVEPYEMVLDADAQWLPYDQSWDSTTGTWRPWIQTVAAFGWTQPTVGSRPVLGQAVYTSGREILTVPQMSFAAGQHLISDFFTGAQAVVFTVSMVVMLRAAVTGKYALLDWNGTAPYPVTRAYVHVSEKLRYGWGGKTGTVDPLVPVTAMRPAFLTLVVSPPEVRLYVSTGPKNTYSTVVPADDEVGTGGTTLKFLLGKSTDTTVTDAANFSLLSAALWSRPLDFSEITALNATYASVWGGS